MLVFDTSALLGMVSDVRRPDLISLIHKIDNRLVVPASVNAEVRTRWARKTLDDLMMNGVISAVGTNTDYELFKFKKMHGSLGYGEVDVILTCKKMSEMGISVTGILDDRAGRRAARREGVDVTGLLGLLTRLHGRHILDDAQYDAVIASLRASGFRLLP